MSKFRSPCDTLVRLHTQDLLLVGCTLEYHTIMQFVRMPPNSRFVEIFINNTSLLECVCLFEHAPTLLSEISPYFTYSSRRSLSADAQMWHFLCNQCDSYETNVFVGLANELHEATKDKATPHNVPTTLMDRRLCVKVLCWLCSPHFHFLEGSIRNA